MNFRAFFMFFPKVVTPGNSRGCVLNKARFFITPDTFMQISMEICIQVTLFFLNLWTIRNLRWRGAKLVQNLHPSYSATNTLQKDAWK